MSGLPATGKTTVAKGLAEVLEIRTINTDQIRDAILKKGTRADVDNCQTDEERMKYDLQEILDPFFDRYPSIVPKYQPKISEQKETIIYPEFFKTAERLLIKYGGVILDATFTKRKWRLEAYELARKHRKSFYLIYCVCPEEVIRKRLEGRRRGNIGVSEVTTMKVYNIVKSGLENPLDDGVSTLVYDSSIPHPSLRNGGIKFAHREKWNSKGLDALAKSLCSIVV